MYCPEYVNSNKDEDITLASYFGDRNSIHRRVVENMTRPNRMSRDMCPTE